MSTRDNARAGTDADRLLALALSRPRDALAESRVILAGSPSAWQASVAHHAQGLVLRQFGDVNQAVTELIEAQKWARRSGDLDRAVDVGATLGLALALAGRPGHGLSVLDDAVDMSTGVLRGRILVRRSHVLWLIGRNGDALRDARRAVELVRGHGDLWEARAVSHRAMAHLALGDIARADRDYARSEELFARCGQEVDYAFARQERGITAFARGDLPQALTYFDDAQELFTGLGVFEPDVVVNKCAALLAAGLLRDAAAEAERGLREIEQQRGTAVSRAELLYTAAMTARMTGDLESARRRGELAIRLFRRQRRPWWAARCGLLLLRCAHEQGGPPTAAMLRAGQDVAARLQSLDPDRAVEAFLLVGQLALDRGRNSLAREHLKRAARARHRSGLVQDVGWLAQALLCHAEGRSRAMLAASRQGLMTLETQLRTLGATEMRALATARGSDLADLALSHVLRHGTPRQVLEWSERWRAVVLESPPVLPDHDSPVPPELAALRTLSRRLDRVPGDPTGGPAEVTLYRERQRLERVVRQRALHARGAGGHPRAVLRMAELRQHLGDAQLLELVEVSGEIVAVVADRRRARMAHVGPVAAAERAVAQARFVLRREGTGRGRQRLDLTAHGARLERDLLGPATGLLGADQVVLVPTGRLHAVPWGLLPALRGRAVSVVPSAASWLRARRASPPPDPRVVLVGGPNLTTGLAEIRGLAGLYPQAQVLASGAATADRVIAAMDGALLVHVAAHGIFRADSPLFSSIELDDGPMTVYDLERMSRAPFRVILSSCNSAVGTPVGADELLGVVSALIARGSAGVLASVVPVDDPSTVPLMLQVHRNLRTGLDLGESLAAAREHLSTDARLLATAAAFIALGV